MKKILLTILFIVVSLNIRGEQKVGKLPMVVGEEISTDKITLFCSYTSTDFVAYKIKTSPGIEKLLNGKISNKERSESEMRDLYYRNMTLKGGDAGFRKAYLAVFTPEELKNLGNECMFVTPVWNSEGDILDVGLSFSTDGKLADIPAEKVATLAYEIKENVKFNVIDDRLNYYDTGFELVCIPFSSILDEKPLFNEHWYNVKY